MRRSDSESRLPPPLCGTHVPDGAQASENDGTVTDAGPVNVVFAGVVKSTWNFQSASVVFVLSATSGLGAPAAGSVRPSKSPGSRPPNWLLVLKHCCVAAAPVSIFARSKAQTFEPRKAVSE